MNVKKGVLADWKSNIKKLDTLFVLIAMVIISEILSKNFLTAQNINNILRQNAGIAVVSMGMLLVILTGGIDLSVGAIVALTSVVLALLLKAGVAYIWAVIISVLLIGGLFGIFNGYFVAYRNLPAFVVTLAVMMIARGFAYIFSKGNPILIRDEAIVDFGSGYFLGIPKLFFLTVIIFAIGFFILRFTSYGRIVMAIGSNEEAVRLCGIRVKAYKSSVYCLCGILAAISGVMVAARTAVGTPVIGEGNELDAIAIVVIGGASLNGGKGTAIKTFFGVFILGMIGNIMNLVNVPAYTQQVVEGFVILFAVFLQSFAPMKNK